MFASNPKVDIVVSYGNDTSMEVFKQSDDNYYLRTAYNSVIHIIKDEATNWNLANNKKIVYINNSAEVIRQTMQDKGLDYLIQLHIIGYEDNSLITMKAISTNQGLTLKVLKTLNLRFYDEMSPAVLENVYLNTMTLIRVINKDYKKTIEASELPVCLMTITNYVHIVTNTNQQTIPQSKIFKPFTLNGDFKGYKFDIQVYNQYGVQNLHFYNPPVASIEIKGASGINTVRIYNIEAINPTKIFYNEDKILSFDMSKSESNSIYIGHFEPIKTIDVFASISLIGGIQYMEDQLVQVGIRYPLNFKNKLKFAFDIVGYSIIPYGNYGISAGIEHQLGNIQQSFGSFLNVYGNVYIGMGNGFAMGLDMGINAHFSIFGIHTGMRPIAWYDPVKQQFDGKFLLYLGAEIYVPFWMRQNNTEIEDTYLAYYIKTEKIAELLKEEKLMEEQQNIAKQKVPTFKLSGNFKGKKFKVMLKYKTETTIFEFTDYEFMNNFSEIEFPYIEGLTSIKIYDVESEKKFFRRRNYESKIIIIEDIEPNNVLNNVIKVSDFEPVKMLHIFILPSIPLISTRDSYYDYYYYYDMFSHIKASMGVRIPINHKSKIIVGVDIDYIYYAPETNTYGSYIWVNSETKHGIGITLGYEHQITKLANRADYMLSVYAETTFIITYRLDIDLEIGLNFRPLPFFSLRVGGNIDSYTDKYSYDRTYSYGTIPPVYLSVIFAAEFYIPIPLRKVR